MTQPDLNPNTERRYAVTVSFVLAIVFFFFTLVADAAGQRTIAWTLLVAAFAFAAILALALRRDPDPRDEESF